MDLEPLHYEASHHPCYSTQHIVRVAHCRSVAVCLTAYSPLGNGDRPWASAEPCLLQDPRRGEIAQRYHKTPAQIILRWHIQRGIVCIPKSVAPSRIQQNLQLFDFALLEEDMKLVDALNRSQRFIVPTVERDNKRPWRDAEHPHFPYNDPYRVNTKSSFPSTQFRAEHFCTKAILMKLGRCVNKNRTL
ncbi:aldo-keto reductase family 1 member A1-A [Hippocampus zosterae]|uniref:aldo-keto reductase family 1 member A1-A n=1 Tax=Hippocampus zosterae TaxID=109293 RepID=UPI00223D523B|nr:aldo-keto reductase family 1 member A1-A [Hippocampus zosterae]